MAATTPFKLGGMNAAFEELSRSLAECADPARAQAMAAYQRGQFAFLGIPAPARREASRAVLKQLGHSPDWDFVSRCWQAAEREYQYVACDHLKRARLDVPDLPRLKNLVSNKSWWDTVDALVKPIGRATDSATMRKWALDGDRWVRRAAILHQLGRGGATNAELLAELVLANLGSEEFFIDKAIGWALRDYSKSEPMWVRAFVDKHAAELAALSRREATKRL